MKKSTTTLHHAAAILIDVLIAVLALLAFLFLQESTKTGSEPKPAAPRVSRSAIPWSTTSDVRPTTAYQTAPTTAATKPTITQVRFEGGRLVPLLSRQ